jgi:hypothetical protein
LRFEASLANSSSQKKGGGGLLQSSFFKKKLAVNNVAGIEEVKMIKDDGILFISTNQKSKLPSLLTPLQLLVMQKSNQSQKCSLEY